MRDIASKQISLRTAKGVAVVLCQPETIPLIKEDKLPKGDLFNIAKAAGFLAAKNTHNLLPHCHPVSLDAFKIEYEYLDTDRPQQGFEAFEGQHGIIIFGSGKSIGRTGIEMEVLTAVSVAALTIYDLLKPVDKNVEITSIKLLEKTGGKTDREPFYKNQQHTAAVLVCSDRISRGERKDESGILIQEMLAKYEVRTVAYQIVPDETEAIQAQINTWVEANIPFIFTTGGTGFSPRDLTVQAVQPLLEKEAVGITEAMRTHGGMRTPVAMLSNAIAGTIGKTTIVTLPGSPSGVKDGLDAILPAVLHTNKMLHRGEH